MQYVQWSFGAHVAAQIGFEIVFSLAAAILAAITFWLFGQVVGFLVVFAAFAWLVRPLMKFRCPSCGYEASQEALEEKGGSASG
jgi:membrane protein implicated in regulation of membrane protease activity